MRQFARLTLGSRLFPGYTPIDLVDKMPCMDGAEYAALAIICGAPPPV